MRGVPNPNPAFPVGTPVRVRPLGKSAGPERRRLVGRVGTVIQSAADELLVAFEGETHPEFFRYNQVEPAPDVVE